jgi:type IV pilus assembly protein PilM
VDLGSVGVRAAQLRPSGEAYLLAAGASLEAPTTGGPAGESASPNPTNRSELLARCLRQTEFRRLGRVGVAVGLTMPELEVHAMQLPAAVGEGDSTAAARVVQFEVERLTAMPAGSFETAYWRLPSPPTPSPNLLGVAASREVILDRMQTCERARLTCTCVDVAAAALARIGSLLRPPPTEQVWGVLDLGLRQTRLILCVEAVPILARTVGAGGQAWTQRIRESLEVSATTAQVEKHEHGIAPPRSESDAPADGDEIAAMIFGVLRGEFTAVASEIKRSYEYVLGCYPGRQAADLILTGGGAAMKGLPEYFADALGIPVRRASSYLGEAAGGLRVAEGMEKSVDGLATAIGLALEPRP